MKRGFTLIELLVALTIILVLAAILLPTFARMKEKAYRAVCSSNLRQIGLAQHFYAADHDGWFCWDVDAGSAGGGTSPGGCWEVNNFSNYLKKSDVLFCPSRLRRPWEGPPSALMWPCTIILPFGQTQNCHTHYMPARVISNRQPASWILAWEKTDFNWTPGHSFGWGSQEAPDTQHWYGYNTTRSAHKGEGSNVLYVDGHVAWMAGTQVGPFYPSPETPDGYDVSVWGSRFYDHS